jgi:hypothetical protein
VERAVIAADDELKMKVVAPMIPLSSSSVSTTTSTSSTSSGAPPTAADAVPSSSHFSFAKKQQPQEPGRKKPTDKPKRKCHYII